MVTLNLKPTKPTKINNLLKTIENLLKLLNSIIKKMFTHNIDNYNYYYYTYGTPRNKLLIFTALPRQIRILYQAIDKKEMQKARQNVSFWGDCFESKNGPKTSYKNSTYRGYNPSCPLIRPFIYLYIYMVIIPFISIVGTQLVWISKNMNMQFGQNICTYTAGA